MKFWRFFLAIMPVFLAGCTYNPVLNPVFTHGVETQQKPWSHTRFFNNPDNFQFAIVADRTGEARKGVFPKAAKKLNLLRPEFVVSVGDLIEGYTKDKAVLQKEWNQFNQFVNYFEMPFFYVAGNHDTGNKELAEVWRDLFGPSYYFFIYKDVLFVIMDTQEYRQKENKGKYLSQQQIDWVKGVLVQHPNVRWTMLFMHQPLWIYETGDIGLDGKVYPPKKTGFKQVERALQGRNYTVIAGHFHAYTKYIRKNKKYFVLATTGGESSLRGPEFGEFDHAVWVTMTSKGPVIANLMIDGIYDENVTTERMMLKQENNAYYEKLLEFVVEEELSTHEKLHFSLPIKNYFKHNLRYDISWDNSEAKWQVVPDKLGGVIAPKQQKILHFTALVTKKNGEPKCRVKLASDDSLDLTKDMSSVKIIRQLERPVFEAVSVAEPPQIDGKLDDGIWQLPKPVAGFRTKADEDITVQTDAWFTYDKDNLYIAFKCNETNMPFIKTEVTQTDGEVWNDDSVEIFIDTDLDRKTYYQIIVNSAGVFYDAKGFDKKVTLGPVVKTSKEKECWIVEIAVPWKNMNISKPEPGQKMGIGLVRTRNEPREIQQCPVLFGDNHQPDMFGDLLFKK